MDYIETEAKKLYDPYSGTENVMSSHPHSIATH